MSEALNYSDYFKIFVSLVAIANPLGIIPLFIGMTGNLDVVQRNKTMNLVPVAVGIILLVSLFIGAQVLEAFGIGMDSFRVGGGILILSMALSMLHAKDSGVRQTEKEAHESIYKEDVAIVPLAMPLLAGPGAISTVILAAHRGDSVVHYAAIALAIIVLCALVWGALRLSPWIEKHISATGINIFTRIMGLILAAIAIEFIANGIKGLFPMLA